MPLNKRTTYTFHRHLYATELTTVQLLHRSDDQLEGVVTAYLLFNCRRQKVYKKGNAIQHDMTSDHRTIWCIPRQELDRVGLPYLNVLDIIVDEFNWYWTPESDTGQEIKLFLNHLNIICKRVDPPTWVPSTNFVGTLQINPLPYTSD